MFKSLPTKKHGAHPPYLSALTNPSSADMDLEALLRDKNLTKEAKIAVLKQWEYDMLEIMVAEEENMSPGIDKEHSSDQFDRIIKAMHRLDPNYKTQNLMTKHGDG